MNLDNTGTKVLPPLSDLGVGDPFVLVLPGARGRHPGAGAEAAVVGEPADGVLEDVVEGLDLGVQCLLQGLVDVSPVAVDGAAAGALGVGDGETVGTAWGRRLAELPDEGRHVLGRHGEKGREQAEADSSKLKDMVEGVARMIDR